MKLNPEDLQVSTFQTVAAIPGTTEPAAPGTIIIIRPDDPTAMTWCYYCPPATLDVGCW